MKGFKLTVAMLVLGVTACSPKINQVKSPNTTPVVSESKSQPDEAPTSTTKESKLGDLTTYRYKTGLFSIDVPQAWTIEDSSNSEKVSVSWKNPRDNSYLKVNVTNASENLTPRQLDGIFSEAVSKETLSLLNGDGEKVEIHLLNGSTKRKTWTYVNKENKYLGNAFIVNKSGKILIVFVMIPEDKLNILKPDIDQILKSLRFNPSVPNGTKKS